MVQPMRTPRAKKSRRRPATTVRELLVPSDPALRAAHALLRRSFHREERVLLRDWLSSMKEKSLGVLTDLTWHLIVAEQKGKVVGFTSGTYLGNINVGVVGYLATVPGVRAQGIGTLLRNRLRRVFHRDARRIAGRPLDAIIGEVAATNPWLRTLARRKNVLVLDFPYFQPRLYPGDKASPFVLYYESLQGPRARIPSAELRRIIYAVWRRLYRVSRPLERPAFRAMLRALDKRRTIGRLKIQQG